MKRILQYVWKYKGSLIFGTVSMLIIIGIDLFSPYLQKVFLDKGIIGGEESLIIPILICFAVISIVKAVLGYGKEYIYDRLASFVQEDIKHTTFNHIQKLEFEYFDNINKNILLDILNRKIKDKDSLWLIQEILYAQKREKGLEIGNYTSQMFANIYLNEIDQYIKHKLKIKYYFRYLDDSVILLKTKSEAKQALEQIKKFLKENLELELNKKTQIFKSKQGVNFCGYKINEYRLKIRDKGKRKLKKKVRKLTEQIKQGKITNKEAHKYLAGHMGYIKIANTYNLENKLFYNDE